VSKTLHFDDGLDGIGENGQQTGNGEELQIGCTNIGSKQGIENRALNISQIPVLRALTNAQFSSEGTGWVFSSNVQS
jgi:hypothetical protein